MNRRALFIFGGACMVVAVAVPFAVQSRPADSQAHSSHHTQMVETPAGEPHSGYDPTIQKQSSLAEVASQPNTANSDTHGH